MVMAHKNAQSTSTKVFFLLFLVEELHRYIFSSGTVPIEGFSFVPLGNYSYFLARLVIWQRGTLAQREIDVQDPSLSEAANYIHC